MVRPTTPYSEILERRIRVRPEVARAIETLAGMTGYSKAHIDSSVTAWHIQALKAVHLTGLRISGVDEGLNRGVAAMKGMSGGGNFRWEWRDQQTVTPPRPQVQVQLGGGKASRLYGLLVRDKQLAQSVQVVQDSASQRSLCEADLLIRRRPGASGAAAGEPVECLSF